MASKKTIRELKAKICKNYVSKKKFDSLKKEVQRLSRQLKKLNKLETQTGKTSSKEKQNKSSTSTSTKLEIKDELTLIKGIGPVLEKKLNNSGIKHFTQIANWSNEEINTFSEELNFKGRVERDNWVEQAKELNKKNQ